MKTRSSFAQSLADTKTTQVEMAVALLWYYRQSQEFEERTASELANDMHEEGYPRQNVTRLGDSLSKSKYVVKGRRKKSYQLNVRYVSELDEKYGPILKIRKLDVEDTVIPSDLVEGTRVYLEKLVFQINGTYQYGFFDSCAVLSRRLMESLIVEVYVSKGRHQEIQKNGVFVGLDRLIAYITADKSLALGRAMPGTMRDVKDLGDVAAHDRTYITRDNDIDDIKLRLRRMINELLTISSVRP